MSKKTEKIKKIKFIFDPERFDEDDLSFKTETTIFYKRGELNLPIDSGYFIELIRKSKKFFLDGEEWQRT